MAKQFTFKYQPKSTGLAGVGFPLRSVDIKFDGKVCGVIDAPNWQTKDNLYRIRLTIKDPEDSLCWKWIQLKFKSEDEKEVRTWLKANTKNIMEKFDIHFIHED